jgi:integrase
MKKGRLEAKFTQAWCKGLKAGKVRQEWYDSETRGLMLRLGSTGTKAFYFFGRVQGHLTRLKLGVFPDMPVSEARDEVQRIRGQAAIGFAPKPRAHELRDEITLGDLFAWYLRTHAKPHKKTWATDESRFKRVLLHWSNRRISPITTAMVKNLHVEIGNATGRDKKGKPLGGKYAANKMLELLGFMWRIGAEQLKFTADDPTRGIKRFETQERERYLTRDELPKFFEAVNNLKRKDSRDFIQIALFTGARRSNVAAMKWSDIDLDEGLWRIEASESKNKAPMRVVLPSAAMIILRDRYNQRKSDWVFPGTGATGHYVDTKGVMNQIKKVPGLEDLRLHDLRRTLGSWQAAQGTSLQIIGKSLGHQSLQSTKIYARLADDPVRAAVESATEAMEVLRPKKAEKNS